METDFILKLLGAFGGLTALILGVLAWNKDRFKLIVEDDAVKRKEVADILQKLYDDLRGEMRVQRDEHRAEIEKIKDDHRKEVEELKLSHSREITNLYSIIKKKDIIIRELIYRLPPEARQAVEAKVDAIESDIFNTTHEHNQERQL